MAALAYIFPPLSGLAAYMWGDSARTRAHGLQSIVLGALWPAALVACSWWTPGATQVTFFVGAGVFVILFVVTLVGRDILLPRLRAWGAESPTAI